MSDLNLARCAEHELKYQFRKAVSKRICDNCSGATVAATHAKRLTEQGGSP
jgi:hypothetical protein